MRVGLLARACDSGLGYLSKDFHDNYGADEVLVVSDADPRYRDNLDWYPAATVVPYEKLEDADLDGFMASIDVLFGYETFYARNIIDAARRTDTHTVLMGMPELTRMPKDQGFLGHADEYVWPTSWLLDRLPGTILPVPVTEQPVHDLEPDHKLSIVHVVGPGAAGDRNGTKLLFAALRQVKASVHVRVCTTAAPIPLRVPANVELEVWGHVGNRHLMYKDCDVLVMPRRYGGLCLPALEAMSCGLAVLMPATSPQIDDWPIIPVACFDDKPMRCAAGMVPRVCVEPVELAAWIDLMAYDRSYVDKAAEAARAWVQDNSWPALSPLYREVLGRACASMR